MKCHACDKRLTDDEAHECFDACFPCNIEHHIGRLIHHVEQNRITLWAVIWRLLLERTSGRSRWPLVLVALLVVTPACTTATTPTPTRPVVTSDDPRFDGTFYAGFARGPWPVSRTVFVADVDDKKQPVPALTIAAAKAAAASLQVALGLPEDVRSVTAGADLLRGLTINWLDSDPLSPSTGGFALASWPGAAFIYYRAATLDVCGGLAPTIVRHELLHAMGFAHTDDPREVLYPQLRYCDILPSPREQFHIRLALGVTP